MYKISGMVIFIFLLIWNVASGNHQLTKRLSIAENQATVLEQEGLLLQETSLIMKAELQTSYLVQGTLEDDIIILKDDVARLNRIIADLYKTEPVVKWRTKIVTNPQYVKCIK